MDRRHLPPAVSPRSTAPHRTMDRTSSRATRWLPSASGQPRWEAASRFASTCLPMVRRHPLRHARRQMIHVEARGRCSWKVALHRLLEPLIEGSPPRFPLNVRFRVSARIHAGSGARRGGVCRHRAHATGRPRWSCRERNQRTGIRRSVAPIRTRGGCSPTRCSTGSRTRDPRPLHY